MSSKAVTYTWYGSLDYRRRLQLSEIWVAATNAGGAIGFLPPVSLADVEALADRTFARVNDGVDHLLAVHIDDVAVGWLVLERDARSFAGHWRTLKRLQVHPSQQGNGFGKALMEEARRFGEEELGLQFLLLSVRAGTGTERFYESLGYEETGRVRLAMRLSASDYRDEIIMVKTLR